MSRRSDRLRRTWVLAAALCVVVGALAASAGAAPTGLGGETEWKLPPEKKGPPAPEKKGPPAPKNGKRGGKGSGKSGGAVGPVGPGSGAFGRSVKEIGESGQVDPIAGLGLRNPVCDKPGQIRSTETRISCSATGTPEGKYPTTNYGFDIFIDSGIDAPFGIFAKGLVLILNGIWLGLIFVLKLVLALLGLAFGLNPFARGESMHDIASALDRTYRSITDPWLSVVIVAGGIWFAYKGLLRRQFAASVGGTMAGIALLVVGLWVVHQPAASVGRLARISDEAALTIVSAPRSGSLARPTGTYAEAMSDTWAQLVEVPFAGLNFSDVRWALGPPPPEAVKRADSKFCLDVGALAVLGTLSEFSEEAARACGQLARRRYGAPKRVVDLYLRSSPGSPARQELWQYFDKDEADKYKAKVAAQGGDGVLTRLSMLALFAVGLLGAVMLLAWLSLRLFTQAAIAFVLLLAAPFAVFFPMLGDSGRKAFKTWGLMLLGATVAKVIYAAFLSVVLLGMTIIGRIGDTTGFLLACAFAWAVFLKRGELVGWMSIGDVEGGRSVPPLAQFLAFAGARNVAGRALGTVGGVGRRTGRVIKQRFDDGSEATKETAKASLAEGARGLADIRHREAQKTVAQYEAQHGGGGSTAGAAKKPKASAGSGTSTAQAPAAAPGSHRTDEPSQADAPAGGEGTSRPAPTADETANYERAKALVKRVKDNEEEGGERWTEKDLQKFTAEDRRQLGRSDNPLDHAHRAGFERAELEEMTGERREQAEQQIKEATQRDRKRLTVASETPGRVVGRGRRTAERYRQFKEQAGPQRAKELQRLRRERREALHRARRRNMSRGS